MPSIPKCFDFKQAIKLWLPVFFLTCPFISASAQTCNCLSELKFIETKAENNLPAYRDQVTIKKREGVYARHKQECNLLAAKINSNKECTYLVAKYVSFFRDEHFRMNFKDDYFPFTSLEDTAAVHSFFQKEEVYPITLNNTGLKDPVCGYWQSKDKKLVVQIIPHKTLLTDYIAVIEKANPTYWSKGQLKFGLKKTGKDRYQSLYLVGSRQPRQYNTMLKGNELTIGRMNIFYRVKESTSVVAENNFTLSEKLEFTELSPATNYLRIPSFELNQYKLIDSIVATNLQTIIKKPNLIIDVRNNGGGGNRSVQALLSLTFDKKAVPDPISAGILVTPDILKYYCDTRYENCENKDDSVSSDSTIALMMRNRGKLTPTSIDTIFVDTVYPSVHKVAILANRWCASTTEWFIIAARQSKKVQVYGENTAGMISYGEWMPVNMPCLPVYLSMPTKKMVLHNNADIESIGIAPDVPLDAIHEERWIQQAQKELEK